MAGTTTDLSFPTLKIIYRGSETTGIIHVSTEDITENESSYVKNNPLVMKEIDGNFKTVENVLGNIETAILKNAQDIASLNTDSSSKSSEISQLNQSISSLQSNNNILSSSIETNKLNISQNALAIQNLNSTIDAKIQASVSEMSEELEQEINENSDDIEIITDSIVEELDYFLTQYGDLI